MTKWHKQLLVGLGAVVLFFAYAWLPLSTSDIWNAPDEMATAYFATAEIGNHVSADDLAPLVHPRSTIVVGGVLLPGGWLGLPWTLRAVHALTNADIDMLELLVPLVAVLAVIAWHRIVARFTKDEWVAWLAALALAAHPGWMYFTNRGLHPNVFFVSLLILGAYMLYVLGYRLRERQRWLRWLTCFVGGLLIGYAVFVRSNELVWIAPLMVVIGALCYQYWRAVLIAGFGFVLPIVMTAHAHQALYGTVLGGYGAHVDEVVLISDAGSQEQIDASSTQEPSMISRLVLPFGLHEMNVLRNVTDFHVNFFILWSVAALLGVVLLLSQWKMLGAEERRRWCWYLLIGAIVSLYLFVVYGSWNINDNPDPNDVTIGTSYIRYWLPVTVWMTIFVGYGIVQSLQAVSSKRTQQVIGGLLVVLFVANGLVMTWYGEDEGLVFVKESLERGQAERAYVLKQTTETDLIITDHSDKFLFPHRNIRTPLRNDTTLQSLPAIVDHVRTREAAVYYLGLPFSETDRDFFVDTYMHPHGLAIEEIGTVGDKMLYRFFEL